MSDQSDRDRNDCLQDARKGTLAHNDQRLQAIRRRANQGVAADQAALREITEAGGAHSGSVNRLI